MTSTLLIAPGSLELRDILQDRIHEWLSKFDQLGFVGVRSEVLHDQLDEYLIENDLEETVITLLFDRNEEVIEYAQDCIVSNETVSLLIFGEVSDGLLAEFQASKSEQLSHADLR